MSDDPMGEVEATPEAAAPAAEPTPAALSEEAEGFLTELGKTFKTDNESDLAATVGRLARVWVEDEMEGALAILEDAPGQRVVAHGVSSDSSPTISRST